MKKTSKRSNVNRKTNHNVGTTPQGSNLYNIKQFFKHLVPTGLK